MPARADLLTIINNDPTGLRDAIQQADVVRALKSIGIVVEDGAVWPLHRKGPDARKDSGKGQTLCGRNGYRHPTITTCKFCLKAVAKK